MGATDRRQNDEGGPAAPGPGETTEDMGADYPAPGHIHRKTVTDAITTVRLPWYGRRERWRVQWTPLKGRSGLSPYTRWLTAALLSVALFTGLSVWLVHGLVSGSDDQPDRRGSSLRVGFAIEAPYAYLDARGRVTGEAPEIFRTMAQRAGIEHIDWIRLDFANLLPELRLGRIDAIAAGMYITPDRAEQAAFTRPTATVRTAVVLREGETALPQQPVLADLARAEGLRWATVHDAAENDLLTAAGVPPERIGTVPQADRGLRAVAESQADAFAISTVTAWYLVSQHPEWPLEVRALADAPAGLPAFVFRREDTALRDAIDQELAGYLGTEEHQLLVQGFGFTSDEIAHEQP